jgi:hypothetical protein
MVVVYLAMLYTGWASRWNWTIYLQGDWRDFQLPLLLAQLVLAPAWQLCMCTIVGLGIGVTKVWRLGVARVGCIVMFLGVTSSARGKLAVGVIDEQRLLLATGLVAIVLFLIELGLMWTALGQSGSKVRRPVRKCMACVASSLTIVGAMLTVSRALSNLELLPGDGHAHAYDERVSVFCINEKTGHVVEVNLGGTRLRVVASEPVFAMGSLVWLPRGVHQSTGAWSRSDESDRWNLWVHGAEGTWTTVATCSGVAAPRALSRTPEFTLPDLASGGDKTRRIARFVEDSGDLDSTRSFPQNVGTALLLAPEDGRALNCPFVTRWITYCTVLDDGLIVLQFGEDQVVCFDPSDNRCWSIASGYSPVCLLADVRRPHGVDPPAP